MKLTIRLKLFAVTAGLILFFVSLSWLLNIFFLDKYYLYSKKNTLMDAYSQINRIYRGDPDDISLELEKLESIKGMRITILNKKLEVKYNERVRELVPVPRLFRRSDAQEYGEISGAMGRRFSQDFIKNGVIIETSRDDRLNASFIRLFSPLDNGDYIFLSMSVSAIQDSADIANKFFLFTGIITLLAGTVIVFFMTGKFTRPILELNKITKGMTTLDFSRRYPVKSQDEIGQLGESINSLSEQLESSIFELKEANQRLTKDIERERKIDEMRKEFVSNVSHELKTPIAIVQGYAEGLKVNVNKDEENKNFYCNMIIDEAFKMNKLVKQLLELSKIESGMLAPERVDFSIFELIDLVLVKSSLIIKDKGIELIFDRQEELRVNADFDRCEQILLNYINNAVDHVDEKKVIRVTTQVKNRKVRVCVFNSGRHIPDECIDKIWMSFYKVDKARTRLYGGTGLGLSIVRAIQESHGNEYGVKNLEGGVEFWFELDISDEHKKYI
ncbi:signal transduction histidine kinase [Anaerobacterium chartisolvens]|uniref:histidine kinase n=1 Tax=Anaerobacterium chartisolvens TaxID=1297424 RepID=A0A369B5C3_9FIRM|nr:HAMP domain-containing sensor histidine kinase [Anaerobacterium chartisolvens]RCX16525.1 signal transduction histidine kinase [Anaerobacterium chartisolvens]